MQTIHFNDGAASRLAVRNVSDLGFLNTPGAYGNHNNYLLDVLALAERGYTIDHDFPWLIVRKRSG